MRVVVSSPPPPPSSVLIPCFQAAGDEGATPEEGPWRLTLDMPSYLPCMQHLKKRDVREKLYRAFTTRASSSGGAGEGGKSLDNEPHIARVLELKKKMAGLLGYGSYAEVSLASKVCVCRVREGGGGSRCMIPSIIVVHVV